MKRRKNKPQDTIQVRMSERDRILLMEHTLADREYAEKLQGGSDGRGLVGDYTLDDLEDMLGYIAAEANHTEHKNLRRELDALYERLFRIQRSYDDGNWNDSAI